MPLQFFRAKPLQAGKLTAIVLALVFATVVFSGLVRDPGVTSFFLVPVLALVLATLVTAETLLAVYRSVRADVPVTDLFANRPTYVVVRGVEAVLVTLSVGAFAYVVDTIPDGPMSGPGAIGLMFIMIGLGLLILSGSLVRTLTEYYWYRRNYAA